MKIKTDDLPVASRKPFVYPAVVKAFVLRTGQASGEPNISVQLESPIGKRFDAIYFKKHWFNGKFNPHEITDPKERNLFYASVGAKNRKGKTQLYLGKDLDDEVGSPEELTALLNECGVGKTFWCVEQQRFEKDGAPRNDYNIRIHVEKPKRIPPGAVVLEPEAVSGGEPSTTT